VSQLTRPQLEYYQKYAQQASIVRQCIAGLAGVDLNALVSEPSHMASRIERGGGDNMDTQPTGQTGTMTVRGVMPSLQEVPLAVSAALVVLADENPGQPLDPRTGRPVFKYQQVWKKARELLNDDRIAVNGKRVTILDK